MTYLTHQVPVCIQDLIFESPRSGRQRKAWGVSPRGRARKRSKFAERAAAESFGRMLSARAITRFAGSIATVIPDLGLTPPANVRSADLKQADASSMLLPLGEGVKTYQH